MIFETINRIVYPVGRVTPTGVSLLGTCFLLGKPGHFVTASHVTSNDDNNLVIVVPNMERLSDYQDTTDNRVTYLNAKISATDPFRDLCVLSTSTDAKSNINIASSDGVSTGDVVAIFGYPHADHGRMVLT